VKHINEVKLTEGSPSGARQTGILYILYRLQNQTCKASKGVPRQAEVAQGVRGRLRPRIFLTFRHYKGDR